MIKIAICDDTYPIAECIKHELEQYEFSEETEVDSFEDGKELYKTCIQKKYDIALIDIELTDEGLSSLPDENGMLLADAIKDYYPEILIIFISAYSHYRTDLLRHEPFCFFDKANIFGDELIETVERAIQRLRKREQNEITFLVKEVWSGNRAVKSKEIIYIESQRPRLKIVLFNEVIVVREKLDEMERNLKFMSIEFIRISKSFLINPQHIQMYKSKKVIMINGTELSIGRKYTESVKEAIKKLC